MRLSRLVSVGAAGSPPQGSRSGQACLARAGYLVGLGPGLVGGSPLLQRVLDRCEARLLRALEDRDAQRVALPASEGRALVNLLLQGGAGRAGRSVAACALGAGFRPGGGEAEGLLGAQLYRRLDAAVLAPPDDERPARLVEALVAALAAAGLAGAGLSGDPAARRLTAPGAEGQAVIELGSLEQRPVGDLDGSGREWTATLLALDLFALVGALAEQHHDAAGLCWPAACAPWEAVVISAAGDTAAARDVAEKVYAELGAAGLPVLIDDREVPPAEKRQRAELWGLPLRVLCGPEAARGSVVVEERRGGVPERTPVAALIARLGGGPGAGARRRLRSRAAF